MFHADSDEFRSNSAENVTKRLFVFFDKTGKNSSEIVRKACFLADSDIMSVLLDIGRK